MHFVDFEGKCAHEYAISEKDNKYNLLAHELSVNNLHEKMCTWNVLPK
jgi:hypothetical protein